MSRRRSSALVALAFAGSLALSSCGQPSQQEQDARASQQNVDKLIASQPVEAGRYSPTREQINNWNRVWQSAPGKLAYIYLFNTGVEQPIGYYITKGPPVSYAANATMPNRPIDNPGTGWSWQPAPGQDGAFYNAGSGTNQFYGTDAKSGQQLEWGGEGIFYLLSDRPLRLKTPPTALGEAVIGDPANAQPGQVGPGLPR